MLALGYSGPKTIPLLVFVGLFVILLAIIIIENRRSPPPQ
jgi:hypothetical protein